MKRLTEKEIINIEKNPFLILQSELLSLINEVKEKRQTEEKLGFDLTVLPIVLNLKDGDIVYHKNDIDGIVKCKVLRFYGVRQLDKYGYYVVDGIGYTPDLSPENYGKTWALTKEELEKWL